MNMFGQDSSLDHYISLTKGQDRGVYVQKGAGLGLGLGRIPCMARFKYLNLLASNRLTDLFDKVMQ